MLQEEVVLQKEVVLLESLPGVQVLGLSVVPLKLIQGSKAKVNLVKKIVLPSCFHTTNDI